MEREWLRLTEINVIENVVPMCVSECCSDNVSGCVLQILQGNQITEHPSTDNVRPRLSEQPAAH